MTRHLQATNTPNALRGLLLILVPTLGVASCGGDDSSTGGTSPCVGAKCDDLDPADFACKELVDQSGRGSANVLEELHDPFAQLALKGGPEGCPTSYRETLDRLRETDAEDCGFGGGMTSRVVSETAQFDPGGLMRVVTTRSCGGRDNFELIFSLFGASPDRLPEAAEIIGFDAETKEFNYYEVGNGEVTFFGSSTDLIKGTGGRCKGCHTGGGLVMKELRNPWMHWEAFGQDGVPDVARELVDAHSEDLGSKSAGSNMESVTKSGNRAWNETRIGILTNPDSGFTVKDLLRPLFCGSEFNIDTAGTSSSGSISRIPEGFFAHCRLFGSCSSTHFGESGGVAMDQTVYESAIMAAGQRVQGVDANDTKFAMPFIEPSMGDIDYIEQLENAGVLDEDFVLDVLAIDFTRAVFSDARCELLQFAPEWADIENADSGGGGDTTTGGADTGGASTTGADTGGASTTGADTGGGSAGGAGNCCEVHAEGGCENTEIQTCVCDLDAFCCDNEWDNLCVEQATNQCNAMCMRSGQLAAEPNTIADATAETLRAAFIANLEAASPEPGTPAAQLLTNLQAADDGQNHRERVTNFVNACGERDQASFMNDVLQVVTVQRNTANGFPVTEFPATMPQTNLNPPSSTHLDAATCELVQ